ncbi:TonB-dependent receptor [marine gamma proteobacterium HTCC2080]|nr:TonB-dependent receptor [marine gamma proteobacterium HTCC2080]
MKKTQKISLALFLSVYASSPLAQTNALEEVVVTATKRAQSLQDVPMAVNAFNADTIETAGINDAGDLAILTPALNINVNTNPFAARMVIRGVGTAQTDPALEPSVGLFIDGIYLGRTGLGMSDLTDIERIEVLQGPQGTLYGKNTNAGAISVITKKPSFEKSEGYIEASVGNYSMNKLTASISGPLTQNLAYRLSGNINQRDGYYDNSAGVDFNDADDWNIQGKLQWEPTESLSILLSGSRVERDTTCCGADAVQDEPVNNELVAQGLSPDSNDPYDYTCRACGHRFAWSLICCL